MELALVLPLLAFVFVVGADFSRVFYYSQLLTEAAHKGAQFASNADLAARLPYETAEEAALADLQALKPIPTVKIVQFDEDTVPTAQVTLTYEFRPLCQQFGLVDSVNLSRSAQMRLHPSSELPEDGEP
ncbi:MAG TPA: TadE family protein [Planctomycetaceae bacterium]|nr:TadE family protein [Planctomycetaceae bacterium]